jgi:hypothetical protein
VTGPQSPRLSKSRFVAGYQCPKLLWWKVNEPDAAELQPDIVLNDLFDQGNLVGARARREWPDGVFIEGDHHDASRIPRTREAIDGGASAIFEACFEQDGVFCAVDVLERRGSDWTVIEVKSSSEAKPYHTPDLAIQVHVCRRAGLNVTRAEVMHLNKEYVHPEAMPLFARTDVTDLVEGMMYEVPERISELLEVLSGPLPEKQVGEHCWFMHECAFHSRCWPDDADHIRNLTSVGPKKTIGYMAQGIHTMSALPASAKLSDKQQRQMRAQRENRMIIEPSLAAALRPAVEAKRLGFLDFETIMRALPVWNGLRPWGQVAAQFSYHERVSGGDISHKAFLAEGPDHPDDLPDDPREKLALAMIDATAGADRVVVYTSFESTRIRILADDLPHLAGPLLDLRERLWDLFPVVSNHVYHPGFRGSFSLKRILNPLVPDLSYDDLMIVDGMVASVQIARLLFVSGRIPPAERDKTRRDLLAYCERDTFATVRLVDRLIELAGEQGSAAPDMLP